MRSFRLKLAALAAGAIVAVPLVDAAHAASTPFTPTPPATAAAVQELATTRITGVAVATVRASHPKTIRDVVAVSGPVGRPLQIQSRREEVANWTTTATITTGANGHVTVRYQADWGLTHWRLYAPPVPGFASALSQERVTRVADRAAPAAVMSPIVDHAYRSAAALRWSLPPNRDLAAVIVRRRTGTTAPPNSTSGTGVPLPTSLATGVIDAKLQAGKRYTYAVFAVDALGHVSRRAQVPVETPRGPTSSATIPATTKLPAAADVLTAAPVAGSTTEVRVRLRAGAPIPSVHGHVVLPVTPDLPDGMLAEVLDVDADADGTTSLVVAPAAMNRVLDGVVIDDASDVQPSSATDSPGRTTHTPVTAAAVRTTAALPTNAWECKTPDGKPKSAAELLESNLDAPVQVTLSHYHWIENFDAGSLIPRRPPSLLMQLTGEADISVVVKPKVSAFSCDLSTPWRRDHRLLRARIGTVPGTAVPVTLTLEPGLSFSFSGSGGVSMTQHRYWGFTVQKYADDPMVTTRASGSADPATVDADGALTFDADFFGDVSIMAGGGYRSANAQAGVYGTLGPYFTVAGKVTASLAQLCITADVGARATIGVRLELWEDRWSFEAGDATLVKKQVFRRCAPPTMPPGSPSPTPTPAPTPPPTTTGHSAITVSAGGLHTCAVMGDHTVECWGANSWGELGNGTSAKLPVLLPTRVSGLADVDSVTAGGGHTCALLSNGTVSCWGLDNFGQLGDGKDNRTQPSRSLPRLVPGLKGIISLAAGGSHTCAVSRAGAAYCWGMNAYGQLGDGLKEDHLSAPVKVRGLGPASMIVAAGERTCALLIDSTVSCWGANGGEIGDGTTVRRSTPTPVGTLTHVKGLYTGPGASDTCAETSDGTVYCWGLGYSNLFPQDVPKGVASPVVVPELANATDIAIGLEHVCSLRDGSVSCMGQNFLGQLGNGTIAQFSEVFPLASVAGLTGVTALTAGDDYSCAVNASASVICWGANGWGTLGDGTTETRSTPTRALTS